MTRNATVLAIITAMLAACSNGGGTSSGAIASGGTATFAENQSSGTVNYIFPMDALQYCQPSNAQFVYLQYRPLYSFGEGSQLVLNKSRSLAEPPIFSAGNTKVTIHLKGWRWSDGTPITSRDLTFWINLVKGTPNNWCQYIPGQFPDNISSIVSESDQQVTLTLDKAYSATWFTDTQLSQIIPIPQHAWDKTSANGSIGDYDQSNSGAQAVYAFLNGQAQDLKSYATNPLWQVVDGPWHLGAFRPEGYAELLPNSRYSGSPKPRLAKFVMEPFTSDTAEANVLQSKGLTYGYVPFEDLSQTRSFQARGYDLVPWPLLSISYVLLNYHNPIIGPIFSQTYVRQAMQSLIDEPAWIKAFLGTAGLVTNGPTPLTPPGVYAPPSEATPRFPYNPDQAITMLKDHGWNVQPDGTTSCAQPGDGNGQCGAGVPSGAKLEFTLQYVNGSTGLSQMMQALKSSFSKAGIKVDLTQGTGNQVVASASVCQPSEPACSWQAVQWGVPAWIVSNPYPSGESVFGTGGGANSGSYSDPINDRNLHAIEQSDDPGNWTRYVDYLATQVPDLWIPNTVNQVSAISKKLHGAVPQSALAQLTPEEWYFTQ
ncbi:ABC transporter substrate-binding protein [Candidatus Nephthysia bennettiae]|uniref:ABC transporter substrate-binding protein n=1 Tax=Candidatus Nephthysia bennettiae TaxID=3127016 RepID=A0A934NAU4_9BACT|nr:ABC transporter substrate-binding protein [Candidatus Dormibacteraeota bacterium]